MSKTWTDKFNIAKADFEEHKLHLSEDEIKDAYAQKFLDIWIRLAENVEKDKVNLHKENSILRKKIAEQEKYLNIANGNILGLKSKLEEVLYKKNNFHTPGSSQKLHGQTIRGILNSYEKGEVSKFLKENKTSRATFYNVIGRKYKNEEYNKKIEKIATAMNVSLPKRS